MSNLYSLTTMQEATRQIVEGLSDRPGNLRPGEVYPDQMAPVVRHGESGPDLVMARWGLPSDDIAGGIRAQRGWPVIVDEGVIEMPFRFPCSGRDE